MTCPQCGAYVDPTETFCKSCGHECGLEEAVPGPVGFHSRVTTPKVTRIVCGKCGKDIPPGERKCPSCGLAVPSREEIEARLASARAAKAVLTTAGAGDLKCPHCGQPLKLRDGLCTGCGQKVELPELLRKALQGSSPSGVHVRLIPSTPMGMGAKRRVRFDLFTMGILAGVIGLSFLLLAGPPFSLRGPFTPAHLAALGLLGMGVILAIVGKFSGSQ